MAWHRQDSKPLSEPMMVSLQTHIYVTRPQLVNSLAPGRWGSKFWKNLVSKHISWIKFSCISCEIAVRWMPQNTFDDKATLIWVMA